MKRSFWMSLFFVMSVGAVGCGNTLGGPCTQGTDCPNQVCITSQPGGYCSKQCTVGQDSSSCPSGGSCVESGVADGLPGCFKTCVRDSDCRGGYTCQARFHGNPNGVCIAPSTP